MNGRTIAVILCSAAFACFCLAGCTATSDWDRSYNLRQWEKTRLAAQAAYLDNNYELAEELLRMSVNFARNLGTSDFRLGATLALLGNAVGRQDKLTEARGVYEKAIASLDESLGLATTTTDRRLIEEDIAFAELSLGDICLKTDDLPAAQRHYERALSLYKQWEGKTNSPVLSENQGWTLLGLGVLIMKQGNSAQAAQTFKKALDSAGAAKYSGGLTRYLQRLRAGSAKGGAGGGSLAAAKAVDQFQEYVFAAKEAVETENIAEAARNYRLAVELGKQIGVEDAKLARAYKSLADNQEILERLSEAEESYRNALQYQDKAVPAGDDDTDAMLVWLSRLSHGRGDDESAHKYLLRQLQLRKKLLGADSYGVAEAQAGLAEVSLALGRSAEARQYAKSGWSILKRTSRTKGDVVLALDTMSRVLLAIGDVAEAEAINDRMLEIYAQKDLRTWRCLVGEFRRQAIIVEKGGRVSWTNPPSTAFIRRGKNRLMLINQLDDDATLLVGQGKLKAAAVLAEGALKLVEAEELAKPKNRVAKVKALTTLATVERRRGNNTRAASLLSEAEKLK